MDSSDMNDSESDDDSHPMRNNIISYDDSDNDLPQVTKNLL